MSGGRDGADAVRRNCLGGGADDTDSGTITVTFRLNSPLPARFYAETSARVGQSYDGNGKCDTRVESSDVDLNGNHQGYNGGLYGNATLEGNGISSSRGTVSVGSDTLTMSFTGAALVRRDYRCLTGLSLNLYAYDSGSRTVDTAQQFSFNGYGPGNVIPPPPGSALSVSWGTPKRNETVSGFLWAPRSLAGTKLCQANVNAAAGVDRVEFSLDGQFLNREYNAPYTCIWDTRKSADGVHLLTATAHDNAGQSRLATIGVNVRNAGVNTVIPAPAIPAGAQVGTLPATTGQSPVPGSVVATPVGPTPVAPRAGTTAPGTRSAPAAAARGRVSFAVLTKSVRSLRASGLLVPVRCSTGCRISLRLVRGRTVIGSGRAALTRRGRRVVTVRLSRTGRRAIRRVRRGTFVVRGTVRDASGNSARVQRRIRLNR